MNIVTGLDDEISVCRLANGVGWVQQWSIAPLGSSPIDLSYVIATRKAAKNPHRPTQRNGSLKSRIQLKSLLIFSVIRLASLIFGLKQMNFIEMIKKTQHFNDSVSHKCFTFRRAVASLEL